MRLSLLGKDKQYKIHPSKIIAVGLNYREHIAESASIKFRGLNNSIPSEPVLFNKTPNVLIPSEHAIHIPAFLSHNAIKGPLRTDFEGELVVIMGRKGKNISEKDALSHIYGYTCGNDVSQRNLQNSDHSGWFRGKSLDTFGPIGPLVALVKQIPDPQDLSIETRVNGIIRQKSNTSKMIFPVSQLIAYISRQFTLCKGDLIFTGTPSGVGALKHGDVVEVEIGGIGTLRNTVIDESWAETH